MEIVSKLAEMYASVAGTVAVMWVLLARYPKNDRIKRWQIVLWFFIEFGLAHFMILPNLVQSILGVGTTILAACIMLDGSKGEKALIVIGVNILMILFSIMGTQIASFVSGDLVSGVIKQGNARASRIIKIVLNNTLYLLTAYILSSRDRRTYKLKRDEVCIITIVYGLEVLAENIGMTLTFLLIGIVMGKGWDTGIYIGVFCGLRRFCGGYMLSF